MDFMRLRYETGVGTIAQFIIMGFLNFINAIFSGVSGCTNSSANDCVSNIILSLLFLILITVWFGFLAILGYAAQDKRSKRLALILLGAESLVALVALFDAKHHPNILGLLTSLIDAALAIWIAVLAYRLWRSGGGRVVSPATARATRGRSRRRPGQSRS